jgi:hypothetical protein
MNTKLLSNSLMNLVDEGLYPKNQLRGEINLARMSYLVRNKIYDNIVEIITLIKKYKSIAEQFYLLKKRMSIHINQLKKLNIKNWETHKNYFLMLIEAIFQLKKISMKEYLQGLK